MNPIRGSGSIVDCFWTIRGGREARQSCFHGLDLCCHHTGSKFRCLGDGENADSDRKGPSSNVFVPLFHQEHRLCSKERIAFLISFMELQQREEIIPTQ